MTAELSVLVVCTANRCRSRMAEPLLGAALDEHGVPAVVGSAGTIRGGWPPMDNTVLAMREVGVEVPETLSRQITPELLRSSDLVVCMERTHVREIAVMAPDVWQRTFTLKELVRRAEACARGTQPFDKWTALLSEGRTTASLTGNSAEDDVEDPVGLPLAEFVRTRDELAGLVGRLAVTLAG